MEAPRIEKDELKRRLDAGEQFTILDDRSPEAWEKADTQIPGSIRVPPDELDKHLQEIPRNGKILTYCT
jgi:rhodanese-related sulfurtransferase